MYGCNIGGIGNGNYVIYNVMLKRGFYFRVFYFFYVVIMGSSKCMIVVFEVIKKYIEFWIYYDKLRREIFVVNVMFYGGWCFICICIYNYGVWNRVGFGFYLFKDIFSNIVIVLLVCSVFCEKELIYKIIIKFVSYFGCFVVYLCRVIYKVILFVILFNKCDFILGGRFRYNCNKWNVNYFSKISFRYCCIVWWGFNYSSFFYNFFIIKGV